MSVTKQLMEKNTSLEFADVL